MGTPAGDNVSIDTFLYMNVHYPSIVLIEGAH